jgi:hypothetical protein
MDVPKKDGHSFVIKSQRQITSIVTSRYNAAHVILPDSGSMRIIALSSKNKK